LADALWAHAEGLYCLQAAVGLLIGHRHWLCREDFVGGFVELVTDTGGGAGLAMVRWRAAVRGLDAGRLPCSDSEGCLLWIAASIAEGVAVDLRDCLSTLDGANVGLVARAVVAAGGDHEAAAALAGVTSR
jgi:hypothetical protein